MRVLVLTVLLGLAGCSTGYIGDRFRSEPGIIAPQLSRYGFNLRETRCVSARLAARLQRQELRKLQERARTISRGFFDPDRLGPRDLLVVAYALGNPEVPLELRNVAAGCGMAVQDVTPGNLALASAAAGPVAAPDAVPPATGGPIEAPAGLSAGTFEADDLRTPPTPGTAPAATAQLPPPEMFGAPAWLNLGAAGTGQAISVDGSSIEREAGARTAWFRMNDRDGGNASLTAFRLRIDCGARTIEPVARRRTDATGAELENEVYPPGRERPEPIEGGTVTEIAYLSLCTGPGIAPAR